MKFDIDKGTSFVMGLLVPSLTWFVGVLTGHNQTVCLVVAAIALIVIFKFSEAKKKEKIKIVWKFMFAGVSIGLLMSFVIIRLVFL